MRVTLNGKRREIGLGAFPAVTLEGARLAGGIEREKIAHAARDGRDYWGDRQAVKDAKRAEAEASAKAEKLMTFRDAVLGFCGRDSGQLDGLSNAKHRAQ